MASQWVKRYAPTLTAAYIKMLRKTLRLEIQGKERLEAARRKSGAVVLAVWHSRFAIVPYSHMDQPLVALVSRHGDGRMLGEVFRKLGFELAFGSSTRGGAQGMREALRAAKKGHAIGLAPDGPRGPRRIAKPGVVALSRLTGFPVMPVTYSAKPAYRFNSWDRTMLPFPFAKSVMIYGNPIEVPRDADLKAQEQARMAVEDELDRITDLADACVSQTPEPAKSAESDA